MAVHYSTPVVTSRLQQVVNAIDAGSTNGIMRLLASGSVASSLTLSKPSASASNGVLTFNNMPLVDPSAVGGIVTGARFEDSNGNIVISGLTVATAPSTYDISITPSNVIAAGQTVAVTAASITGQ